MALVQPLDEILKLRIDLIEIRRRIEFVLSAQSEKSARFCFDV